MKCCRCGMIIQARHTTLDRPEYGDRAIEFHCPGCEVVFKWHKRGNLCRLMWLETETGSRSSGKSSKG